MFPVGDELSYVRSATQRFTVPDARNDKRPGCKEGDCSTSGLADSRIGKKSIKVKRPGYHCEPSLWGPGPALCWAIAIKLEAVPIGIG